MKNKYRNMMTGDADSPNGAGRDSVVVEGSAQAAAPFDTGGDRVSAQDASAVQAGAGVVVGNDEIPKVESSLLADDKSPAPVDDEGSSSASRPKRRRSRAGRAHAADGPVKPVGKMIDEPYKAEPESGTVGGYKAYGEPLASGSRPGEFSELKAMEELLANEGEYGSLPLPEVFNAYPPEVQRKIMEWADRDVKASRDDESRRKDELVRATIERERRKQMLPTIIVVVSVICAAILGFATGDPWFSVAFLIVPIAVIVAVFVSDNIASNKNDRFRKPPKA